MVKLRNANEKDLVNLAEYMSSINSSTMMRCAYIGLDKFEILEYLKEIYEDNCKAIFFIEDGEKILGAVAGDVCDDNNTIEVIGPFIDLDFIERKQYGHKMIDGIKELNSQYRLKFFIDEDNLFIRELILDNNGNKVGDHYTMSMELSNYKESQDGFKGEKKCIQYTNSGVEENDIKYQIEKLHDKLFKNSYYNGETIIRAVDEKHILDYYLEKGKVVSYIFYNIEDEGYIEFLGTDTMARKMGYAGELLRHSFKFMKNHSCINVGLCVDANNKAISLYEKFLFKVDEKNQAYVVL